MKQILFISLLLLGFCGFSQQQDSIKVERKFEFLKYHSNRVKKLKTGRYLQVYLLNGDTTHLQSGELVSLNDSVLIIDVMFEDFQFENDSCFYRKDFTYDTEIETSIPISSIDYIGYESIPSFIFASVGGVSLLTALFVAPLISIDKNATNHFNSKRYTTVVVPALIGTAVGLGVYYSIGTDTMLKLRLPKK